MASSTYKYINTIKAGNSVFELYKSETGQFKTVRIVQGSYVPQEQFFDNQDELLRVFSGYISKEELSG